MEHLDELDDDQRARLCVVIQLHDQLSMCSEEPTTPRDIIQFAHWVITGANPDPSWHFARTLRAPTPTEHGEQISPAVDNRISWQPAVE